VFFTALISCMGTKTTFICDCCLREADSNLGGSRSHQRCQRCKQLMPEDNRDLCEICLLASAADGAKLIVAVLSEVAGATTETQQSAQTVLTASESVEKAAANLRSEVESFLTKVAV